MGQPRSIQLFRRMGSQGPFTMMLEKDGHTFEANHIQGTAYIRIDGTANCWVGVCCEEEYDAVTKVLVSLFMIDPQAPWAEAFLKLLKFEFL